MPGKSTRFLIDTNLFIAAVKRGNTKSTELFLRLLDGSWELVADDILVSEYEKYAKKFEADAFLAILLGKLVIIEQSEEDILSCKPLFPSRESADIVHAATCLHTGAILITNDAHFRRISEDGLIEVWSISEAIERLLEKPATISKAMQLSEFQAAWSQSLLPIPASFRTCARSLTPISFP